MLKTDYVIFKYVE